MGSHTQHPTINTRKKLKMSYFVLHHVLHKVDFVLHIGPPFFSQMSHMSYMSYIFFSRCSHVRACVRAYIFLSDFVGHVGHVGHSLSTFYIYCYLYKIFSKNQHIWKCVQSTHLSYISKLCKTCRT